MIDLLEAENNLADTELMLLNLRYEYILKILGFKRALSYYPELKQLK